MNKNLGKFLADLRLLIDATDPVLLDDTPRCAYLRLKRLLDLEDICGLETNE